MATQADAAHAEHGHHEVHHPYHLVEPSPWPVAGALSALVLVTGGLLYMHDYPAGVWIMLLAVLGLAYTLVHWWRDVIQEGRTGHHTDVVSKGLRIGMALFITSEVLFFFAFFWAYFWGALHHPDDGRGLHLAARGRASGRRLGHPVPQHDDPAALGLHGDLGAPCDPRERQPDRLQGARADRGARRAVHVLPGLRVRPHHLQPGRLPDHERDLRLDLLHGDRLPRLSRHDRHDASSPSA